MEQEIKADPNKEKSGTRWLHREILLTFKEEPTPILLNSSKKLKRREHFQTHAMRPELPVTKSKKETTKKPQTSISDEY